jgi:lipopolysaccharide transport system permease protein
VFMSGIFFPLTALPYNYAWILLHVNPLVPIIEDARRTLIWGLMPDWKMWAFTTITSFVLMLFGYWWFMRSRKAFADVV